MNKTVTRSESKEIDTALRDQMIFEKMQNIIESDLFRGGLIVLMILLGLGIYLMNHMIVVRIQYDINGTVGYVSGMFPNNILLITARNHIVCSKFGIIYDTFDCRNYEVESVWLVS